jgi:pimeloyl-ACP methyl ester carboxylesterase
LGEVRLDEGLGLHLDEDDFADPWSPHEAVLLIHGFAESGRIWFAWVPHLARRFRVLRPDLRGFGRSTSPGAGATYPFSAAGFAEDLERLLDALEVPRVHLVGARLGGPIGVHLAARRPELVQTLSIVSGLARGGDVRAMSMESDGAQVALADFGASIRRRGLSEWFAETGRARLGSDASAEQVAWWNDLMAGSDEEVCIGLMAAAAKLDVYDVLPLVKAPTLVLAAQASALQSVETTRDWQSRIPDSELQLVPGDSPHLAATRPDYCAERVLDFIARRAPTSRC